MVTVVYQIPHFARNWKLPGVNCKNRKRGGSRDCHILEPCSRCGSSVSTDPFTWGSVVAVAAAHMNAKSRPGRPQSSLVTDPPACTAQAAQNLLPPASQASTSDNKFPFATREFSLRLRIAAACPTPKAPQGNKLFQVRVQFSQVPHGTAKKLCWTLW